MTALFALATSLLWGLADFGGGLLARRIPALTVVVVSQSIAAVVLGAIVLATGAWSEAGPQLWFAVAAGLVGPVGMLAFYKALALGPMGVVSPLASLGIAVPVAVGLVLGERPGLVQFAGIAVAVVGVVLAGGPQLQGRARAAAGRAAHPGRGVRLRCGDGPDRRGVVHPHRPLPRPVRTARHERRRRAARPCTSPSGAAAWLPRRSRGSPSRPWRSSASRTSPPTARTRWPPSTARSPWPPSSPRSARWSRPSPRAASSASGCAGSRRRARAWRCVGTVLLATG